MTPPPSVAGATVAVPEWQIRCDLAALYRLVAHHRMTDLIYTHISARVPGPEHHFLINPYGILFHEITASSLVKIDLDGRVVDAGVSGIDDEVTRIEEFMRRLGSDHYAVEATVELVR
jgi:hypothetical protein